LIDPVIDYKLIQLTFSYTLNPRTFLSFFLHIVFISCTYLSAVCDQWIKQYTT